MKNKTINKIMKKILVFIIALVSFNSIAQTKIYNQPVKYRVTPNLSVVDSILTKSSADLLTATSVEDFKTQIGLDSYVLKTGDIMTGNLTAPAFIGDGSQVTNVDAETLDGLNSSNFARNDITNTFNANQVIKSNNNTLIRSSTEVNNVGLDFSTIVNLSQFGTLEYSHLDSQSYGSGNSFTLKSTEATMTFLVDGKLMYKEGIYSKPVSGTGAGVRKDLNWDKAYSWGNQTGTLAGNDFSLKIGDYGGSGNGNFIEIDDGNSVVVIETHNVHLKNKTNSFQSDLSLSALTANQVLTIPDETGTIATQEWVQSNSSNTQSGSLKVFTNAVSNTTTNTNEVHYSYTLAGNVFKTGDVINISISGTTTPGGKRDFNINFGNSGIVSTNSLQSNHISTYNLSFNIEIKLIAINANNFLYKSTVLHDSLTTGIEGIKMHTSTSSQDLTTSKVIQIGSNCGDVGGMTFKSATIEIVKAL